MKIKMPNGDNFAYIGPFGMAEYMENACNKMREQDNYSSDIPRITISTVIDDEEGEDEINIIIID